MNEKATILVVDDNHANLKVLLDYLTLAGFLTLIATSGESALLQIQRRVPDLILLDVIMPGLDGFETCRHFKENQKSRDVPVIFMTALSDAKNKVKGFQAGAVDYVTKPFQYEELLARINTHLTLCNLQKELRVENEQRKVAEKTLRKHTHQLEERNQELEEALAAVKTLRGLLPICAGCKKIRDDAGYWQQVDVYIKEHSNVEFSHGLCPDCRKTLYPEFYGDDTEE